MFVPKGMKEEDVVAAIVLTSKKLSSIFKFGYYTQEDIEQVAFQIMLTPDTQGRLTLEKYDGVQPLENFLYVHIHNRLCNFKRDNYERLTKPCTSCPFFIKETCTQYHNPTACDLYNDWVRRTAPKKSLVNAADLSSPTNEGSYTQKDEDIDHKLLFELIDKKLPVDLREDYIKIKHGFKINKQRKADIITKIREILVEHGFSPDLWGSDDNT